MVEDQYPDGMFVDANGCPAERFLMDGQEVIVHYADIPESDITTVGGIRVTTPLRTVIDIAPDLETPELDLVIRDCLNRKLFDIEEARARIAQPDMASRPGAHLLGLRLPR